MPSTPIVLNKAAGEPLYRQIEGQLREAILDRRLRPGATLPSVRRLALELGVARITVVAAYDQLAAEGYVEGRAGVGTIVSAELPEQWMRVRAASIRHRRRLRHPEIRLPEITPHAFSSPFFEGPNPFSREKVAFDFTTGSTSLDLFPLDVWERMLRVSWRQLSAGSSSAATDYRQPAGDPVLREALAQYLGMARGVRADAGDIVVTAGAQGAMGAAVRLWLDPSRRFVVEDPGGPHLWRTFQVSGAEMVGVPVDGSGLQVDSLPDSAATALVTPSWQYPAGGTLPLSRRMALLDWARTAGAVIIEDDCDSELRYEGHPLASLQGLDQEGRVLYVGTFSKVMFPGLRTGYAVVPERAGSAFRAMVEALDRGPGAVEQRALALFIREGHFERHLRRLRLAFAERQEAMLSALRHDFDGILDARPMPAGTHLVATITDRRWTASAMAAVAAASGILVEPLAFSRLRPAPDRELLMHYGRLAPFEIRAGMRALAQAVRRSAPTSSLEAWG